MANFGPLNSVGGYNSGEVDWDAFHQGMFPQTAASPPAIAPNRPTPAQLAAMQAVPAGSYRTPPNRPIMAPNIPSGSQYADTGNVGRATPEMQQLLALASASGSRPPWTVPQPPSAQNVSLPRPRPPNAPTWMDFAAMNQQQGANPGMGGAMIGNGQMSPQIPPQGPPPAGIAPTVWAGNNSQQQAGPLNITVRGGRPAGPTGTTAAGYQYTGGAQTGKAPWVGNMNPSQQYDAANYAGQMAAKQRQAQATGTAGGYQYQNGQKVGYAPQTIGGATYMPTSGASAYSLANMAGQQRALERQAAGRAAGLMTPVEKLQAGGMSAAQAYAAANSGSGSVAAMEAKHSGRPEGAYTDSRSSGTFGSLW